MELPLSREEASAMERTTRNLLITLGVLLVAALGLPVVIALMMGTDFTAPGQTGQVPPFGPWMMHGYGWMGGLGMGLGMLLFWGIVIVGLYLLIHSTTGASASLHQSTPLEVLKRRYAAGEITREQYQQMRKDLD
jgi:putative membrane protein